MIVVAYEQDSAHAASIAASLDQAVGAADSAKKSSDSEKKSRRKVSVKSFPPCSVLAFQLLRMFALSHVVFISQPGSLTCSMSWQRLCSICYLACIYVFRIS